MAVARVVRAFRPALRERPHNYWLKRFFFSPLDAGLKSVCENSIFTQPLVRPQIGKHNRLRKFLVLTHPLKPLIIMNRLNADLKVRATRTSRISAASFAARFRVFVDRAC